MKGPNTHTNGQGCCKEPIEKNQASGCCNSQTPNQPCCCNGEEAIHQPCCCGQQEADPHVGCCQSADVIDDMHHQTCNAEIPSLEQLQKLLMEANNKYMRLYAEFDNFKKRQVKERIALTNKANEQTLKELLPIVDDFERCIMSLQGAQEAPQHIEGIKLIYDKLAGILKKYGVEEIAIEQGSVFNADLHEAIMQQPVDNPEMQGKIVSVVEKGYLINEYVLRFAKVIIGV
ncbi:MULTISPECIES: nucleotide exchange factor GrpE [Candidatus Cardinium]|uniref:nucleotide exchange factor GrpE n=1 Tax=Candidatus Cardinium TaxID=273135 RepID=UPI001FA95922|nr:MULTISPECIES: nucleotide exchange factor GrpE [Cardinium]